MPTPQVNHHPGILCKASGIRTHCPGLSTARGLWSQAEVPKGDPMGQGSEHTLFLLP